ncbi:MAG: SPOR domain-containing protein [Terriglobales bacterium]
MGTKSLLAWFIALAVVCGLFFAFGYTIGKHAIPATFSLGATQPPARRAALGAPPAVAPGVQAPNPVQLGAAETNQTPSALTPAASTNPGTAAAAPPTPATNPPSSAAPPQSTNPGPAAAIPPPPAPSGSASANSRAGNPVNVGGQLFNVQVFSGDSSDANQLAQALKARGYPAQVVPPASNAGYNLYSVQVGPYLTRAEAEAMRSRLRADGYQAALQDGGN